MNLLSYFLGAGGLRTGILLIVTGQSVAAGEENEANTLTSDLLTVDPGLRTANYRNSWPRPGQPLTFTAPLQNENLSMEPLQADVTAYNLYSYPISGAELTITRNLKAVYGGVINLAKFAFGGWPISNWLAGGQMRVAMARVIPEVIQSILDEGYDAVKIPFLTWYQGESDALNNRTASQYFADLENFALWFWSLYPSVTAGVPFILRDISTMQTAISATQRNNINGGFQLFVEAYPDLAVRQNVDNLPITIKPDQNIHWPLTDLQKIGAQVVPLAQSLGYL